MEVSPRWATGTPDCTRTEGSCFVSYWEEADREEPEFRFLSRASLKQVQRGVKELVVSEVNSPPRVAEAAKDMGHEPGGSFDLDTGLISPRWQTEKVLARATEQASGSVGRVSPMQLILFATRLEREESSSK